MSALFLRALVAITLALCPASPLPKVRVVARVNDDAITDFELNQRVVSRPQRRHAGQPGHPPALAAQILRQMIDERLQLQHAKGLGVGVTEAETNQRVSEIERAAGMPRGQFRPMCSPSACPTMSPCSRSGRHRLGQDRAPARAPAGRSFGCRDRRRPDPHPEQCREDDSRVAEIFVPIDKVEQADDAKRAGRPRPRAAQARCAICCPRPAILAGRLVAARRRPRLDPARLARPRARNRYRQTAASPAV